MFTAAALAVSIDLTIRYFTFWEFLYNSLCAIPQAFPGQVHKLPGSPFRFKNKGVSGGCLLFFFLVININCVRGVSMPYFSGTKMHDLGFRVHSFCTAAVCEYNLAGFVKNDPIAFA